MNVTQDQITQAVSTVATATVIISHVIAFTGLPSWFPSWVSVLINAVAANYGKSTNAADQKTTAQDDKA